MRPPPTLPPRPALAAPRVLAALACLSLGLATHLVGPTARTAPRHPAHAQASDNPLGTSANPIGQVGGVTRVIVPDGDRLWIGIGPRVAAVDGAGSEGPGGLHVAGRSPWMDGVVYDLAVEGKAGVASTEGPALYTLDLADPAAPAVAGSVDVGAILRTGAPGVDASVREVALADGYAYAVVQVTSPTQGLIHADVVVVDVRDPRKPRVALPSLLAPDIHAVDLVIAGTVLAVAVTDDPGAGIDRRRAALQVYALQEPSAPRLRSVHDDPAWVRLAAGPAPSLSHQVYGYDGGTKLAALDLRNAARPVVVERYGVLGMYGDDSPRESARLTVLGDGSPLVLRPGPFRYAEILRPKAGSANPDRWFDYHIGSLGGDAAGGLAARGSLAFTAEVGGLLRVLDLAPEAARYRDLGTLNTVGTAVDVALGRGTDAGTLYATTHQGGVVSLDIRDPADPQPLGAAIDGNDHAGLSVEEGVATVISTGAADVISTAYHFFDVRDPAAPLQNLRALIGGRHVTTAAMARSGPWLYVFEENAKRQPLLGAHDLSDPAAPRRVISHTLGGAITDIAIDGHVLALVRKARQPAELGTRPRLEVYAIDDPTSPRIRRLADVDFGAVDSGSLDLAQVAVAGHYLFTGAQSLNSREGIFQMRVFDIADPADPRAVALLALPFRPLDLVVRDGYAFANLACEYRNVACHVAIIDLRDPGQPRLAGQIPSRSLPAFFHPAAYANGVAVGRGLVYVAHGEAGIYVYRPGLDWPPGSDIATAPPPTATPVPRPATPTQPVPTGTPTQPLPTGTPIPTTDSPDRPHVVFMPFCYNQ